MAKPRHGDKFPPGSDYFKIRSLADLLGDDYSAWGNGIVVPSWGKRLEFDPETGDLVKIQRITSGGNYRDLGTADEEVLMKK